MAILHREDKEIEQVEKEMFETLPSLREVDEALKALEEILQQFHSNPLALEARKEADELVERLEEAVRTRSTDPLLEW
ncbi:MAG: hypothetical protein GXN92_03715 [Candidatus Micrarchaeota archaeon]|nr:hypothetical protein [Candidatus Micrarchaeota archaeon]